MQKNLDFFRIAEYNKPVPTREHFEKNKLQTDKKTMESSIKNDLNNRAARHVDVDVELSTQELVRFFAEYYVPRQLMERHGFDVRRQFTYEQITTAVRNMLCKPSERTGKFRLNREKILAAVEKWCAGREAADVISASNTVRCGTVAAAVADALANEIKNA